MEDNILVRVTVRLKIEPGLTREKIFDKCNHCEFRKCGDMVFLTLYSQERKTIVQINAIDILEVIIEDISEEE